jgi:hypothetical protein
MVKKPCVTGPTKPYMSPPHLKITPLDGGGYPPKTVHKGIAKKLTGKKKKIKSQEDKKMYSDIITDTLLEKEAEPTGTEVKEVPKCPEGMRW